ncbi:threonine-phosphate decarboxylase [Catenovulum sp. SM1970]|uniref:threonine-phosphate decarboxylase CobD n=1 Tax=Marinifaba aquimaris TaxID=2741323 RepID=UPI001571F00F|nr:threonine-phosphate decarboxylase CobD [Marinifaba aquimaris]NTS76338.1 threonine-phosphate decarboxylase [Marinifaba aquimaris]
MALIHGGQLNQVAAQYQIPVSEWLDLSTGIAPISYPVGDIPASVWQQLPQRDDELIDLACQYYFERVSAAAKQHIMAISGSQAIIQTLPQFVQNESIAKQVFVPDVGYKEHQQAWLNAGYQLVHYAQDIDLTLLAQVIPEQAVVVLINPNNPSGQLYAAEQISQLLSQVTAKQGLLIVDEAFADIVAPNYSVADLVFEPDYQDSLIVLRSVGKFFGLAGIRLGFVIASQNWIQLFSERLGPWQVNGAAQYIGKQALADTRWQLEQKHQLAELANHLTVLLDQTFAQKSRGTDLFRTVTHPNAAELYQQLCQQGVYARLTDDQQALRFGLATAEQLTKLSSVLNTLVL